MFQKVAWNFTQTLRLVHRSNFMGDCIFVRLATIRHTCETHGKTYDIIHDEFFMPHHVIQNDNEIPPPQYRARQEVQNVRFVDFGQFIPCWKVYSVPILHITKIIIWGKTN